MLMAADDRSDLWQQSIDIDDGDDGLSIDIESLWEILGESPPDPGPLQDNPGDLSGGKVQQGQSPSDSGNNEHSILGLDKRSLTFSPSHNFEAPDSRMGTPDDSFESAGNSVTFDHEKQGLPAQSGSPASCSGSLADWMLPASCRHSSIAGSNGVIQSVLSYGRDYCEETQNEIPNCSAAFSFTAGVANDASDFREVLDSNQLKSETEFQLGHSEGDTYSQHGSLHAFMGKPETLETSMMGIDALLPWALHDGFNLPYIPSSDEMTTYIEDELEELPNQTSLVQGATVYEAEEVKAVGSVFAELMTNEPDVSGLNVKCKSYNLLSPTRGDSFGNTHDITKSTKAFLPTFTPTLPNMSTINPMVCVEDEKNDESVLALRRGFDVKLLPPNLPSNSSKNLLFRAKDEKEDLFIASKRVRHHLDSNYCLDAKSLEKPHVQPYTSMKKMGYDDVECELIQPKSMETHISNFSCQTIQSNAKGNSYCVDDDEDICIIEDISAPSRSNLWSMNWKALVTPQHCTTEIQNRNHLSGEKQEEFCRQAQAVLARKEQHEKAKVVDPLNPMGMGGVKPRANEEQLIVQVVLQDLSQPKTEASPPDGLLAVPLLRHQRIALSWMVQKETASLPCSGGILADDQGLGKTISTIALILKERAPSSRAGPDHLKHSEMETLNLDEDDDYVSGVDGPKQDVESFQVLGNGLSQKKRDTFVQTKGRPAAGTLVVCPTSVLRQWAEELLNKVTKKANLSVLVYHGGNRTKDPCELAKYDVVLTTYSIVSMEVPKQPLVDKDDTEIGRQEAHVVSSSRKRKYPPTSGKRSAKDKEGMNNGIFESSARPLARVGWFRVVLDEAQSIKNHKTQVARACWGLRAKRRWCLSGTPIQNAVDDLYSYFRFLRHDLYGVYKSFCSMIKVPISKNPVNGYKKLQAVLRTIMLRRTKGTLLDGEPIINLPPKSIELKKVEFTDEERDFYCRLEADSRAQFAEYVAEGTVKQNYVNILLMLLRLRQACDHPLLIRGYNSSSAWRSTVEKAKKLPREKQVCLLNCLEASLAICGICNDPPEDAVVTSCGHVFCNQCVSEHLTGDDNQCPTTNCKAQLSVSSLFSRETLKCSLSEQPAQDSILDCSGSEVSDKLEPGSWSHSFDSSKIKAALEVLQSLSKPRDCTPRPWSLESIEDGATHLENSSDPLFSGSDFVKGSNDLIRVAGEKAIVFSQWTRMLDLLETGLIKSSIKYRRLDGTMSITARDKAVKDFNTLPEVSVMIMSLKAASLGLNMVAACHVLLLDLWWNPTTEDQAIDRAHRIGQTRPVTVLRLTVKDTVEDRILALQQKKREMVASAFGEDESGNRQTRLTAEDLNFLFMS
ncbi:helicase-like transcription factor CHR28 isoform X2 [Rhododendron vialii]|uniref:helicase-like transcription factor CHR28 isoform X2 n=1 Tax=Rhododendron vialii TaxID=182163 RepID=UPI00265DC5E6|nr:helicase-like transcription factor CHR28 isoform X2 [Rhododendron vialii]